jgi:thiamine kinase
MLDAEGLARQWVPGRGKPVVRLIARGLWHATYRVRRDARWYAMRVPTGPATAAVADPPGDHTWDQRVFAAAAAAGLGPTIASCDPASGILVTGWVAGRSWTRAQAILSANMRRIAELVRRIQALTPAGPCRAMSPADWVAHYTQLLKRNGARQHTRSTGLALSASRRLSALAGLTPAAPVLCHSDLHRLNLVDGDAGLTVLDWEYAHLSEPFWDLAGWISANDLGALHCGELLTSYLGRGSTPGEEARMQLLIWLYDYVCLLWSDAYFPMAARAKRLAARLA